MIEWLEIERAFYAKLTAELESKVLTVTEGSITDSANTKNMSDKNKESEMWPAWKELSSELHELPTALCDVGNDIMIEWIYTINLDFELFSVNNWIFFDLWDIPRDRWIQAFQCDEDQTSFSHEICPEGSAGVIPPDYFDDDDGERDKYRMLYQRYSHATVHAIGEVDVFSQAALQQIVTIMVFQKITAPYASHFWKYVPEWGHENFAFREVAFAILSLAAGQYRLDNPNRFCGHRKKHASSGYLLDRGTGSESKLMPLFGSGCHRPGQEPGSAPSSSIYWFENVLVSLVPDTVLEEDAEVAVAEAAVAKVVEYGLKEGNTNFQAVVFSILNAIMLEIHVKDGLKKIKRTRVVPIYIAAIMGDQEDINGNSLDIDCQADVVTPVRQICQKQSGFVSLQNFFNVATNRHLSVFREARFPTEIYARIIANADYSTTNACAKVSPTFRML